MSQIFRLLDKLTQYGIALGLLPKSERVYATNLMLDILHLDNYDGKFVDDVELAKELKSCNYGDILDKILSEFLKYALANELIEDYLPFYDIFDTKLMNCMIPRPDVVIERFKEDLKISAVFATENYYTFSQNTNYLRRYRLAKDVRWSVSTEYGVFDILISLSKPELDPKTIALAGKVRSSGYPQCVLCKENEGYAGRIDFAARQNHRIIPCVLCGENFSFQFSPYGYCYHHCIILNNVHTPMIINVLTIRKLLEAVTLFPHYFVGSNADLPYVGGSVLSHEHFQGGWYELPIMRAKSLKRFTFNNVQVEILYWPLSAIRLIGDTIDVVVDIAQIVIDAWYTYSCGDIIAETDGERHNTITPLAHRFGNRYVLYLIFRNNRCTKEYPNGLFHTRPEYFHIKKEGIGIMDAPGLAILPSRLKRELLMIKACLLEHTSLDAAEETAKHSEWVRSFISKYNTIDNTTIDMILQTEVGIVFKNMLEDCAVFKHTKQGDEEFVHFIEAIHV